MLKQQGSTMFLAFFTLYNVQYRYIFSQPFLNDYPPNTNLSLYPGSKYLSWWALSYRFFAYHQILWGCPSCRVLNGPPTHYYTFCPKTKGLILSIEYTSVARGRRISERQTLSSIRGHKKMKLSKFGIIALRVCFWYGTDILCLISWPI